MKVVTESAGPQSGPTSQGGGGAAAAAPAATVLFIVDALGLGGKTKSMVDLACNLDPSRYRSVVCSFSTETGVLAERLRESGIPLYSVPCPDGLNFSMVARLAPLMWKLRPAVVHCYNPRPIIYGGVAARLSGIRATVGSLSAFACQVPDRTYDFLPQQLSTVSRRNVYRNRIAARLMQHLVTVSSTLGERFFSYNRLPPHKLRVVSYGADVDRFSRPQPEEIAAMRQRIGARQGEILIGSVGRLVEQKDYPTQLRAFALASAQVPELRMVLAGDGPLLNPLKELVHELGLEHRVTFLGLSTEVPLLMRSLDIFVLASKFEPYGVVLLEAKAAGVPIASTSVNEIPEIVSDGQSGLLAPPGDPAKLAEILVKLATNPALRRRLGQRAVEEARERHSLQAMIKGYQEIYDEIRSR